MTDTVVFDLGGVLVDFHPADGMRKLGFTEDAVDAFMSRIFSGFWESCDSCVYTSEAIRKVFKEKLPEYPREVDALWDDLPVITGIRPYTMAWIRDLKAKGMRLYVLSNFGNVAFEINSKVYEFLPLMDGRLISYELGITKPDKRIYEKLFRRFAIDPERAVFIDDRQINVEGARAAGMRGILFENYEQARQTLDEYINLQINE